MDNFNTIINTQPEKIKALIDESLNEGKTQDIESLFAQGVNIFYFETIFKLLFYPLLLFKLLIIYLLSKPERYARIIPIEEWNERRKNCGIQFSNNISSIKKISSLARETLIMSDFTRLSDPYYFAALVLLVKHSKGSELIDNIVLKKNNCKFVQTIIDMLSIQNTNKSSLGAKLKTIRGMSAKHLLVFSLMAARSIDPSEEMPIPLEIIELVIPKILTTQALMRFHSLLSHAYGIPIVSGLEHKQIIRVIVETYVQINQNHPESHHHIQAITTAVTTARTAILGPMSLKDVATPLATFLTLSNKKAGEIYFKTLLEIDSKNSQSSLKEVGKTSKLTFSPKNIPIVMENAHKIYNIHGEDQRKLNK